MFRFETADVMIPIVEMANHLNDCLHSSPVPEPCDPEQGNTQWATKAPPPPLAATIGSGVFGLAAAAQGQLSGQCLVWRAATPVAAGEELCICYGKSLQDRMVLQYGFLEVGWKGLYVCMYVCMKHTCYTTVLWGLRGESTHPDQPALRRECLRMLSFTPASSATILPAVSAISSCGCSTAGVASPSPLLRRTKLPSSC